MLITSPQSIQIIKKNNRSYTAQIDLELINLNQDTSLATLAEHQRKGSMVEQIVDSDLTYQQHRLHIGMPLGHTLWPNPTMAMPDKDRYRQRTWAAYSLCGYVGLCNNDSEIEEERISLRFAIRSFKNLFIHFAADRTPQEYRVEILNKKNQVIWSKNMKNPQTKEKIETDFKGQAHKIDLIILQRPKSNLRSHLLLMSPSYTIYLDDFDISQFKIDRKKSADITSMGCACTASLNMTLFNAKRFYDLANKESPYYQNLREGAVLRVKLTLNNNENSHIQEILPLGTFYISSWSSHESDAQVKIQAADLLSFTKDRRLYGPLYENISAQRAFETFGQAIGLRSCVIHGNLSQLNLENIAIDGKAGDIIQNLCAQTLSLAEVSPDGKTLIVRQMQGLPALSRYCLRKFDTHEYSNLTENFPRRVNTFHCNYNLLEFEGDSEGERLMSSEYQQSISYTKMYEQSFPPAEETHPDQEDFVADRFPDSWRNKPWARPIGAHAQPSWQGELKIPDRFLRLEFSDEFTYEGLEYQWDYIRGNDGTIIQPAKVWWKVWLFQYDNKNDQDKILTLYTVIKPKSREILRHSEAIPERPAAYITPPIDSENIPQEFSENEIRKRNWQNEPYTFTVTTGDKVHIDHIVPQNFYQAGWLEFIIMPTAGGAVIDVWNYSPHSQDFELIVYGRRIRENQQQRKNTISIPHLISEDGKIEQEISLPAACGQQTAENMLKNLAGYMQSVCGEINVQVWSDPRIALTDRLGFLSLRGYANKQGLVEGISLEYDGVLKQKLDLTLVKQVNRDCRVYGGFVISDRPQQGRNFLSYPNEGLY